MPVHTIMACQSLGHDSVLLFLYRDVRRNLGRPAGEVFRGASINRDIVRAFDIWGLGDSFSGYV